MKSPNAPQLASPPLATPLFPLPDLAHLFIGFPMEQASKTTREKVVLLQAEDLQSGTIPPTLEQAVIANLPAEQIIEAGDIVLVQLGNHYRAIPFTAPEPRTVCAAPLLVLRLHDKTRIDPHWLCQYLHTSAVQQRLCQYLGQTDAHEGALSNLHGLHLPVPARAWQQNLLALAGKFAEMERHLQTVLTTLRQNNGAIWLALAHEGR